MPTIDVCCKNETCVLLLQYQNSSKILKWSYFPEKKSFKEKFTILSIILL